MEPRVNFKHISFLIVFILVFSTIAQALPPETYGLTGNTTTPGLPGPFHITLFIPSPNMIHSDQVLDQVNTPEGGVLFGTSFGLSLFNGTWSTRHINRDNISEGLMDEYVTAVEYDHDGNLWIGYSGGIQIYNGVYYRTIRDQQLLKDTRIHDLQRWHDDMWIATGNSGIHRYRNGIWTWYQPMTKDGPGFYEIHEMALDPMGDSLLIDTADNGLWIIRSPEDPVVFEQIETKDGTYSPQQHVRRDPLGGGYFFNDTRVVHYSTASGFSPILNVHDLTLEDIAINDLAASPEGEIFLATDKGIYIWKDNAVYRYLGRFEGIGTSEVVRTITIDAHNRVWFSTKGYVGYYEEQSNLQNPIRIQVVTPAAPYIPTPILTAISPLNQTGSSPISEVTPEPEKVQGGLDPILNPILRAINAILSKIGIAF
jgi:ligand-binding sensor domain-containing protein